MRRFIPFLKSPPVVSVLRLQGVIASGTRGTLNDQALAGLIEKAFTRGKPAAVSLSINSPGGSPTQSSLIAARIRRLAEEKDVKVYAFVEDVAASGGYYIASAADEIWVDRHSITGSIGVISAGFGLSEFIGRYGIERRVYTAGKSKSLGDPFRPAELKAVLKDLRASGGIGPGRRGSLPTHGSHRPVRAHINAYGSSNHGFTARRKIEREVRTGASG